MTIVDGYAEMMRRNPYAFPMGNPTHGGYDGMTLRDYFAGQVAAGFFASKSRPTTMAEDDATWFYQVADAMLAARQEPTS